MTIAIRPEPLTSATAGRLIMALNAELSAMYNDPGANHFGLTPDDVAPGRGAFLVVWQDDTAIGCGAVRLVEPGTGELKRMYVAAGLRGQKVGHRLVAALEEEARRLGARRLILETGTRQLAAIALYQKCGFAAIPLYGEYLQSPRTSRCFGKELAPDGI